MSTLAIADGNWSKFIVMFRHLGRLGKAHGIQIFKKSTVTGSMFTLLAFTTIFLYTLYITRQ